MNNIIISGILGQVESRFTQDTQKPTAIAYLTFTTDDRGSAVANTLKVTAWGQKLSPALAANSGQEVILEGRLQMNKRESNGIKKTVPELIVSRIHGVEPSTTAMATPVAQKAATPDESLEDIPF